MEINTGRVSDDLSVSWGIASVQEDKALEELKRIGEQIGFWEDVGAVCMLCGLVCLAAAVTLYFRWGIRDIWFELTGRAAREGIARLQKKLEQP